MVHKIVLANVSKALNKCPIKEDSIFFANIEEFEAKCNLIFLLDY